MSARYYRPLFFAYVWLLVGCSSVLPLSTSSARGIPHSKLEAPGKSKVETSWPKALNSPELTIAEKTAYKLSLINSYQKWLETPYQYSGENHQGIDCSAFVRQVYIEALGVALPRTTREQVMLGKPVAQAQLQVGDLVFFKTGKHTRHVGIYLGDHKFISATGSRGVNMSDLERPYWQRRYWQGRRIVDNTEVINTIRQALVAKTHALKIKKEKWVAERAEKKRKQEQMMVNYASTHPRVDHGSANDQAVKRIITKHCALQTHWIRYTVKAGDNLSQIAHHFNVHLDRLTRANRLSGDVINIGQVLQIPQSYYPTGFSYTVKAGDNLSQIAHRFHTTTHELKVLNDLSSDVIQIHQTLKLPC
ncbi:C40 family peptidase [Vibrio coralliilyticus]|uniref:C40 family peptidase n=1 Tax=Vibrio coralliilyticus TaxID=190893 RepID=UPI0017A15701|nr:NlpC/P60 family protein [Vibrio coralliilyticus]NUW67108.1 C40 family peptidase [Vibrio coralliilyticus]